MHRLLYWSFSDFLQFLGILVILCNKYLKAYELCIKGTFSKEYTHPKHMMFECTYTPIQPISFCKRIHTLIHIQIYVYIQYTSKSSHPNYDVAGFLTDSHYEPQIGRMGMICKLWSYTSSLYDETIKASPRFYALNL